MLDEDAKLRYNMNKMTIYIPGVSRERARELVLQHITQDPSLANPRELYDLDLAKPELDIINVTAGVPMGTPAFVNAFVRSKAQDITMCTSFALSLIQGFMLTCCVFVNTRAWPSLRVAYLLTS